MKEWISLAISEYGFYLLVFLGILLLKYVPKYLRKRKINKLKYEGEGIMKKAIISAAKEAYIDGNDDSSGYYVYRLETKDETGNLYRSEDFRNAKHGGRTVEEMKKKYDGVVYDLSDKDNVIKQITDNINRLEQELQNDPGFFRKMSLKQDLKAMKNYLEIANEGPITPYLIINGHKISVGDPVNVFVDPENPKSYYFDLEFTKEN